MKSRRFIFGQIKMIIRRRRRRRTGKKEKESLIEFIIITVKV